MTICLALSLMIRVPICADSHLIACARDNRYRCINYLSVCISVHRMHVCMCEYVCTCIIMIVSMLHALYAGHILSRIYNCTKAGNRRAKRGGSRESEGGVRGESPEGENFMDIRTRP